MGGANLPWTEERKEMVKKLWLDGKSATEMRNDPWRRHHP